MNIERATYLRYGLPLLTSVGLQGPSLPHVDAFSRGQVVWHGLVSV